ncbi:MAG: carbamoyltransferase HypF [Gemmatimonadota bacterium]|nr:carbamoyltransferase HypF [Gemmatimonadota bacterium]
MARSQPNRFPLERLRVTIQGAVQGVGFRPFVYKLARSLSLAGWVNNSVHGVTVEVEGPGSRLLEFLARLTPEAPPQARIHSMESTYLDAVGYTAFAIRESDAAGARTAIVLPDVATCGDCLREVFDPGDRRYRYPFTNCTNCGPRFSIVESLPYDRANTTMRGFVMCEACRAEYEDPASRRFHAQPNACPVCGPRLMLWDAAGRALAAEHDALRHAADAVGRGEIVALKGLGGFHLVVDARNDAAVRRLRSRKHREEKPLALMYASLENAALDTEIDASERRLLLSSAAPIVLLRRRASAQVAASVAPGNPYLGVMLPYTPLHHLLLDELRAPIVATSGNLSNEPICTDEREALQRLGGVADVFLVHDRPIARHVDDSIVHVVAGRDQLLRRARGYAPLPFRLPAAGGRVLAVGGYLKNTVALAIDDQVFVSQHVGDLDTEAAYRAFEEVIASLTRLYEARPEVVACDLHPDYSSTHYARALDARPRGVQHHLAHVLACMVENEFDAPALGVAWDGTGYGTDGTIWGGEFFHVTAETTRRVAHLRTFPLPGGEQAIREPRRSALGLLFELAGKVNADWADLASSASFTAQERRVVEQMLRERVNSPRTSSVGRLFDAVASLLGLRQINHFEGQAAMELEFQIAALASADDCAYTLALREAEEGLVRVDWEPLVRAIVTDLRRGAAPRSIARAFHDAMASAVVAVAERVGARSVVLSGGCFQNRYLSEETIRRLRDRGFRPYWHQRIPPNDGGIALGQVAAVAESRFFDGAFVI